MRSTQNLSPKNGINLGSVSGVLEIDGSKANSYEAILAGNATLNITNLPPGQDCSVFVTQDGAGGHSVGFSGMTIEKVDAASLVPAQAASASTSWVFQGVFQGAGTPGICRLVSAGGNGSGGGSGSTSPTIQLPDSNQVIVAITNPRNNYPVLTAPRTMTLDAAGATIGDAFVASKTDTTRIPAYVEYEAGKKIRISSPGQKVSFRQQGTAFVPESSTARVGDAVIYATDYFNDDLSRVVGDGITDNATGLQRFLDAIGGKIDGFRCSRGHIPAGLYLTSAELKLYGGSVAFGNYPGLRLTGDVGSTHGLSGSCIQYSGPENPTGCLFKCVGVTGGLIENLDFNGTGLIQKVVWVSIENLPFGDESSQHTKLYCCGAALPLDTVDASCFGYGPVDGTIISGQSDVAELVFEKCIAQATGGTTATHIAGFMAYNWNNTKNIAIEDCTSYYCYAGVNALLCGGGLSIVNHYSQSCIWDFLKHSGHMVLMGCNSEGSSFLMSDAGGSPSTCTMIECRWNGLPINETPFIQTAGSLSIIDSTFVSARMTGVVSAADTTANTISMILATAPVEGDSFYLWNVDGTGTFPAPLREGVLYSVRNPTTVLGVYVFQVSIGPAGAIIDLTTAGSLGTGAIRTGQPLKIKIPTPTANNSENAAVVVQNSFFSANYDVLALFDANVNVLDPDSGVPAPRAFTVNNFGGVVGGIRALRDRSGKAQEYQSLSHALTSSDGGIQLVRMGVPGEPDIYKVDFQQLKAVLGGTAQSIEFLRLPETQGIEWATVSVDTAFAGIGIKLYVDDFDTAISTGQLGSMLGVNTATGIDLSTTGQKGLAAAEQGIDFTDPVRHYFGVHWLGPTHLARIFIQGAANFSGLVSGLAYVSIKRRITHG